MKDKKTKSEKKKHYVVPKVLATYEKEELEETIKTQGSFQGSPVVTDTD